jgi:transposase
MEVRLMSQLSEAINNPVVWVAAGGWLVRELWHGYKSRNKQIDEKIQAHDNRITSLVDRFTHEVHQLQMGMANLNAELKNLARFGAEFPKIQKDLDALHSKVRDLSK